MFKRITPVCDQSLTQTLRRTSIQLIDLSAPLAELACEVILDCLDHLDPVNSARICGFVSSLRPSQTKCSVALPSCAFRKLGSIALEGSPLSFSFR